MLLRREQKMNYYFLQIKEGPHGGPFHDCVYKWIRAEYAAVFTKNSYDLESLKAKVDNKDLTDISRDVFDFIEFGEKSKKSDDSIIISIGEKEGKDHLFIYKKDGEIEEIKDSKVEVDSKYYNNNPAQTDHAIGFRIKLLKDIPVVDCPLVLATIKSNIRIAMGTFKTIITPGNIKAIEHILSGKEVKVDSFTQYLECLSPVEFETLIAKIKEEEGYFVPAYKGGMLKDYDLICKSKEESLKQENIQVKLNLSGSTYNKYKEKKDLIIYCVTKSDEIIDSKIVIRDSSCIKEELRKLPKTTAWLKESLSWVKYSPQKCGE